LKGFAEMALMQINVIPLGSGSSSVGDFVAAIISSLERQGVEYKLTDMGTVVEGEAVDLFKLAARIHETPFQMGAQRVVTQIVIDDRRDKSVAIGDKISSVERRLKTSEV
jgi:uncharacterized protein (TIGR00106 family)